MVRGISRIDLIAITINTIIGAGIFGLPSKVTALIGSYSLLAFIACAVIIAFIVLCSAEASSRFQNNRVVPTFTHKRRLVRKSALRSGGFTGSCGLRRLPQIATYRSAYLACSCIPVPNEGNSSVHDQLFWPFLDNDGS